MSRKTDEELLAEMKSKKKREPIWDEEDEEDKDKEDEDTDDEVPEIEPKKVPTQIVERAIDLNLINDKLNFIISKLSQK